MESPFLLARFHSVFGNRFWFLVEDVDLKEKIETMAVTGSFNYWAPGAAWQMRREGERKWILDVPLGRIEAPGNSGYPEYQFLINGIEVMGANYFPEEPRIGNNFLIVPHQDKESWKHRSEELLVPRTGNGASWLSNFRQISGGTLAQGILYRSSHPFLSALPDSREAARKTAVQRLWKEHHINRVINLADGEGVLFDPECTKEYLLSGRDGKVLFIPADYTTVYYHSRGNLFLAMMGQILEYISLGGGPWVVHCRLGIDRTGVTSAILQALTGSLWKDITNDYSDTMGFGPREYRHKNLLAYSFSRLLGQDPMQIHDLQSETGKALARSVTSKEILVKAVENLSRKPNT